jgi:catechol 2,3-dioxygenase-like lactoylglutathione lyase family enzyme
MIDHLSYPYANYDAAKAFFRAALASLGYAPVVEFDDGKVCGFGAGGGAEFWIAAGDTVTPRLHIAFRAETRAAVDAFYAAAMAAGGTDNGGPGLRPDYAPTYYAAFVIDPDGHNIEAVCHAAE